MTPRLVKFEIEHLTAVDWREHGNAAQMQRGIEMIKNFPCMAFTGMAGDKLLGSAGVVNWGYGTGYAWVIVAPEIEHYKLWFHRTVRMYFRAIIRTWNLKRVEAEVKEYSQRNCQWIEALGFKPTDETRMVDWKLYRDWVLEMPK